MRTIKFRGYNAKNKEWLYGCYLINRGEHFICPDGIQHLGKTPEDFQIDPKTLGQFTGLYDKNGKEIYEGDIIGYKCDSLYVVAYNDTFASYALNKVGYKIEPFIVHITQGWLNEFNKVVIGNIYDNPELLKGGEG